MAKGLERSDPADFHSADLDMVARAAARDGDAFRSIMKTHNQRLYRLARGIVRDNGEAEDIVQEAYVRAFTHLDGFRGDSTLATWLSRIVINEALGRLRKTRRTAAAACDRRSAPTGRGHPVPPQREHRRPGAGDGAKADSATGRTGDGQPSRPLPDGLRRAGDRGAEHRRDGEPARHTARDGQDQAAPRPIAGAQANSTRRSGPSCSTLFRLPAAAANG